MTAVHEKNGEIIHYTDAPLTVGETVTGEIDWERRFRNMQGHSGEHLVSGLIHAKYGYDNVGFHMGSEEITIDLNGLLEWEELLEIEIKSKQDHLGEPRGLCGISVRRGTGKDRLPE